MVRVNHGIGTIETGATIGTKVAGISIQGEAMIKASEGAIIDVRHVINGLLLILVHEVPNPVFQ